MANHPRSPLTQALIDMSLLWVLLAIAFAIQLAQVLELQLPLLAKTTLWRLGHSGWAVIGVLASVVLGTTALAVSHPHPDRRYFIAGAFAGLALAFFVVFDPGTGVAFAATSANIYRRLRGQVRYASSA